LHNFKFLLHGFFLPDGVVSRLPASIQQFGLLFLQNFTSFVILLYFLQNLVFFIFVGAHNPLHCVKFLCSLLILALFGQHQVMITLHRLLFHDLFFLEALLLDLPLASSFILLHSDADLASVLFLLKLFQSLLFSFSSLLQL
jgi:hypothetical protein